MITVNTMEEMDIVLRIASSFAKRFSKMLKIGELRIEPMKSSGEVSMMEGQDEMTGVCRVQQTAHGPPRLILVKPSYTKGNHNAMPYNYGYASNVQAPLPLSSLR